MQDLSRTLPGRSTTAVALHETQHANPAAQVVTAPTADAPVAFDAALQGVSGSKSGGGHAQGITWASFRSPNAFEAGLTSTFASCFK